MSIPTGPVLSGVPQGSVIGPILFLIYINDLPDKVGATIRLFADETSIYMTLTGAQDAASLQQDLNHLANLEKWQMKCHPKKCSVLRSTRSLSPKLPNYRLHGHILKTETDSKYLRVTINNQRSWNNHICVTKQTPQ